MRKLEAALAAVGSTDPEFASALKGALSPLSSSEEEEGSLEEERAWLSRAQRLAVEDDRLSE